MGDVTILSGPRAGTTIKDESDDGSVSAGIKKFVGAVAGAVAPRSITQRKKRLDEAEQASNAGAQSQSTDASNGY